MRFSIMSHCRDLSTGVICSVLGFLLLHEQVSSAVTGDEIFVLAVSLGKKSYSSLNLSCRRKVAITFTVFEVERCGEDHGYDRCKH